MKNWKEHSTSEELINNIKKRHAYKRVLRKNLTILISFTIIVITCFTIAACSNISSYSAPNKYTEIQVNEGDTLWTLAKKYYPGKDTRKAVIMLKQINKIDKADIYVGDILMVPETSEKT